MYVEFLVCYNSVVFETQCTCMWHASIFRKMNEKHKNASTILYFVVQKHQNQRRTFTPDLTYQACDVPHAYRWLVYNGRGVSKLVEKEWKRERGRRQRREK